MKLGTSELVIVLKFLMRLQKNNFTGMSSFDDIAYADDNLFNEFIETLRKLHELNLLLRTLLLTMGAVTEEEDNIESYQT